MSDDAEVVLLTLPRGEKGELRVMRSRYQGRTFTKAQIYYPADGQLLPGRQVVTFRDHELGDVIDVLKKIAAKVGPVERRERREHRSGPRRMEPDPPPPASEEELELDRRIF